MQHAPACWPVKLAMRDMDSITICVKPALAVHSSQVTTVKVSHSTFTITNIKKLVLTIVQPVPAYRLVSHVMQDMVSTITCVKPVLAVLSSQAAIVQVFN